jgi:hypothetical protein
MLRLHLNFLSNGATLCSGGDTGDSLLKFVSHTTLDGTYCYYLLYCYEYVQLILLLILVEALNVQSHRPRLGQLLGGGRYA